MGRRQLYKVKLSNDKNNFLNPKLFLKMYYVVGTYAGCLFSIAATINFPRAEVMKFW